MMRKIAFTCGLAKRALAFTLIEMVIVVAIIATLTVVVIATASRIQSKAKEELTANTISILTAALSEFQNYDYDYNSVSDYDDFKFPLDCNGFTQTETQDVLEEALGTTNIIIAGYNSTDSGSEMWYFFLTRIPQCRSILDRIDNSLKKDTGVSITVDSGKYQLFRVIDTWDNTLQYDYYEEYPPPIDPCDLKAMKDSRRAFPVVTSAGPDKQFDTRDDIVSR